MGKDTTVEAPDVPDPNTIAQTDALYNRINTFTPFGNLTFSGPYLNNATISLPQAQQQQLDYQNAITLGGLQQALSRQGELSTLPDLAQGLDFSGLSALPGADMFSEDAGAVEQATFDRLANLLRPEFEQSESALRASLNNRGIMTNAALADTELDRLARQQNSALEQAALSAVQAGRAEQSRLYQQALTGRQQGINEQLQDMQLQAASRGTLFNELQALLGQQQVAQPGISSFFAPGQSDVTGAYGIATGAAQNTFNTQQQAASQKFGDTAQLAGTIVGGK